MGNRKKKHKKNKKKFINNAVNKKVRNIINVDEKTLVRAIVQAYKEIEETKTNEQGDENVDIPKKRKWIMDILFFLNVLFFPFKINEKFTVREGIYDSILAFFVAFILNCVGLLCWVVGIVAVIFAVFVAFFSKSLSTGFCCFGCGLFILMIGSLMIISANEFSKVTDSNKIYAYSASVLALISGVVAIVSLVLQLV